MHRAAMWFVLAVASGNGLAVPARAAVRVEQDEVIFSLRHPGAREVYLVGDFNQWNPTVERMNGTDGRFEIGLFLVAGNYHYKFVVDGEWIFDPDNPGRAKDPGSPLLIIERGDGLVLSTEPAPGGEAVRGAHVGARYIGRLLADGDDADGWQRVDLVVSGRYDRLDARARVATDDSSWAWSPPGLDAYFDRGRARVHLGKLHVDGFENDSTWVAAGPLPLVGNAGVYGYDAGFRRHGVSAEAVASRASLRALWAGSTTRAPAPGASVPGTDLAGFAGGTSADTTVYGFMNTYDGSDVLALDAALDFGDVGAGISWRAESGVNPGVAAPISRGPTDFSARVLATGERRDVSTLWLRHDDLFGLRTRAAWGWGGIDARATGAGEYGGDLSTGVSAAAATSAAKADLPLLDTRRAVVELAAGGEPATARATWSWTEFDFETSAGGGRATAHRVTVEAEAGWSAWRFALRDVYTHPDYGDAPDALTVDGTAFNPWLSLWDGYGVEEIVGLALGEYNVLRLSARCDSTRVSGGAAFVLETAELAADAVHASLGADARWRLRGPWSLSIDARGAWYDEARFGDGGTFFGGWVQGAWERGPFLVRAGFGFDPWVFDPVSAGYAGIGRSEFLRAVLAGGVTRSGSAETAATLVSRERDLEDAGVFKLECVVDLR